VGNDDGQRATIRRAVELAGTGLHSGRPVRMRVLPAPPGEGLAFRCPGATGAVTIPATLASLADGRQATTLAAGGVRVRTVEHVLAALAMQGIDDVVVDLDADEPPAADGSAAPFVSLLEGAGRRPGGGVRDAVRIVSTVSVTAGAGAISIEPAEAFGVEYEIDFDAAVIGRQTMSIPRLDRATFAREIAPARTFGFHADVDRLRAAGLACGASLDNTVVVSEQGVMNDGGLRWPDEFVRHKVLDLVGDLALLGRPLIGRVRVRRGGHALHHALLQALAARPAAWRIGGPGASRGIETEAAGSRPAPTSS